jgi:chromosome segregation ATPase
MTKILLIVTSVLAFVAVGLFYANKGLKTDLTAANSQITELNSKIEGFKNEISKYNRAQERAAETIEKVRTVVRTVQSDCDCYNTLLPDGVRKILRED